MPNSYFVKYFSGANIEGLKGEKLNLSYIHPKSTGKIPGVTASLVYNDNGFSGRFDVNDFSVLAEFNEDNQPMWKDSCVEFFLKPQNSIGHICFEFNCIGSLYSSYIRDEKKVDGKFHDSVHLSMDECGLVKRQSKLSERIFPEKAGQINWWVEFFIPFSLLEKYFGNFSHKSGDVFFANFYKCGDNLIQPHWLAWNPVSELNFHVENDFGKLILSDKK